LPSSRSGPSGWKLDDLSCLWAALCFFLAYPSLFLELLGLVHFSIFLLQCKVAPTLLGQLVSPNLAVVEGVAVVVVAVVFFLFFWICCNEWFNTIDINIDFLFI